MQIKFKKVIIHNFFSYGHVEICLEDLGHCLVSGINKCPVDNAASNGSGKSVFASAICWALCGETIQGISSGVKNINTDENLCYVSVEFIVDANNYIITRYKNPKSDLKIILNDEDISGKGIRESEAILLQHLPDISRQLIASVIILGQGLPDKFTANTPSGRKDVLEKLSLSDFMIKDVKDRIAARQLLLEKNLRELQDIQLEKLTLKKSEEVKKEEFERQQVELQNNDKWDSEIENLKTANNKTALEINETQEKINQLNSEIADLSNSLDQHQRSESEALILENNLFNIFYQQYLQKLSELNQQINTATAKKIELENASDVCPTCGQKLPDNLKLDKSKLSDICSEISAATANLNILKQKYEDNNSKHNFALTQIRAEFESEILKIRAALKEKHNLINIFNAKNAELRTAAINSAAKLAELNAKKESYVKNAAILISGISNAKLTIENLQSEILYNIKEQEQVNIRIDIINKMNTFIKRDFRGYLLLDVIHFIEQKAKEYCIDIFGNNNLKFILNNNSIEITYNEKPFENLSGGEKQKIDLIIQFAIRDMMQEYLGFSSNILVLDEILDQLDYQGCMNILSLISKKFTDVESMFIISHRAHELEIPYDHQITVIKNELGISRILMQ